jgi:diguanylate cyclase (GGDEF)-like protein
LQKPDIPRNEQARLETLRSLSILDTPAEERFDRLTRMTKRLLDVPVVLISLVDEDRQWFKSCMGLSDTETSRDISFCGHAILGNGVFIIPDALEDERFVDNPLVVNAPNIRFYAGCPLRAPNGLKMGTLCILDQKPRNISADDLEALKDLAAMVEREIAAVQMATYDELTGIYNRRGFKTIAQYSLNLCARQQIPAALVFMDLDKFKQINDRFGHAEGDRALITFAEQIKATYRNSDVVARLGGDEFAALLPNTSKLLAEDLVTILQQSLKKHQQEISLDYDINFSYGIVEFDYERHPTIDVLLAGGDSLMYELKRSKRDN